MPVSVPVMVWLLPAQTGVVVALKAAVGRGFTVTVVLAGKLLAEQLASLRAVMAYVVLAVMAAGVMLNGEVAAVATGWVTPLAV